VAVSEFLPIWSTSSLLPSESLLRNSFQIPRRQQALPRVNRGWVERPGMKRSNGLERSSARLPKRDHMAKPEDAARTLLLSAGIDGPPTPVERLVRESGVSLVFQPFEGNISGMLYRDGERRVIGINSAHAAVRQRFSIAHELGHLELHPGRPVILDHVVRMDFRDQRSSTATDRQEIEANRFAAELLMPRDWVMREATRRTGRAREVRGDDLVQDLADEFDVSQQAMEYRLANLGLRRLM